MPDLRERAMAATPGPWDIATDTEYGDYGSVFGTSILGVYAAGDRDAPFGSEANPWVVRFDDDYGTDQGADAAYIAAASPDVILALLDERDALREVAAAARAWWASNRPVDWTEDIHGRFPDVNVSGPEARALAIVLAARLDSLGGTE